MNNITKKTGYISIAELAKMLGISRIAVYNKVKKGQIPAQQIGRSFVISMDDVNELIQTGTSKILTEEKKREINKAVGKVVKEYGETLRLLGKE